MNKLKQGDVVYLVWDAKLHEYIMKEVVSGIDNLEIQLDFVIYTGEFVNSKERVFIIISE